MLVCRAIKKHGPDAFECRAIEECDESSLGDREMHWIRELGTHVSQGGYNLTLGGDGGLSGYVFSDESREKIRQKALGRKHTPETIEKLRVAKRGRKQRPEVVAARAEKLRGQKRSEEQKARMKAGQRAFYAQRKAEQEKVN
jgi:group I intron endonuclease